MPSSIALCRSTIRDKIIPHAVSWFTGEAIQEEEIELDDDEDDDDIDEDEDDEGDDDEDEDEDDEEDEEDDEGKTKKKVCYCSFLIGQIPIEMRSITNYIYFFLFWLEMSLQSSAGSKV